MTFNRTHKYCLNATGGPLRITLVWADPPPSSYAGVIAVNDLDLTVWADALNSNLLLGNGERDRTNNVEQVAQPLPMMKALVSRHTKYAVHFTL
jgi:hypothetical protein